MSPDDVANTTIVLPGTRAIRFFHHYALKNNRSEPVSLLPRCTTMGLLIEAITPFEVCSGDQLIPLLYRSARDVGFPVRDFDAFYSIASTLLADFAEIDHGLCNPELFFKSLRDYKDIDDWSFAMEPLTANQESQLNFWDKLGQLYRTFRANCFEQKTLTPAQNTRWAAENRDRLLLPRNGQYCFAGFNAFTAAENQLIDLLIAEDRARVVWDLSPYYLQPGHQAGIFLPERESRSQQWMTVDIEDRPVQISVTGVSGDIDQAMQLRSILQAIPEKEWPETVVILTSDHLLPVVLEHGIPAGMHYNSSIGRMPDQLPVLGLFRAMMRCLRLMMVTAAGGIHIPTEEVKNLLAAWRSCSGQSSASDLNAAQLRSTMMAHEEVAALFGVSPPGKALLDFLQPGSVSKDALSSWTGWWVERAQETGGRDPYGLSEKLLSIITETAGTLQNEGIQCSWTTVGQMVERRMTELHLFTEGDPFSGVQIMGMLETRALDFRHVIILGCEEGKLPVTGQLQSYIPFDLRTHFDLPGEWKKESVYAYYFYRLLHCTEYLHLLYSNAENEMYSAEKSRFIRQLEMEYCRINPNAVYRETSQAPDFNPDIRINRERMIERSDWVQDQIKAWMKRGVSASKLNEFVRCPLDFAFKNIVRARESEPDEIITPAVKGDILHTVLEQWYEPYIGKPLKASFDPDELAGILAKNMADKLWAGYRKQGQLRFYEQLFHRELQTLLECDNQRLQQVPATLVAVEQRLHIDDHLGDIPYRLVGVVDRCERNADGLYVIDYKTGKVEPSDLQWSDAERAMRKDKLVQMMVYGLLSAAHYNDAVIRCGIYSIPGIDHGLMPVREGRELLNFAGADNRQNAREVIRTILEKIVHSPEPFKHQANAAFCQHCL